MLAGAQQGLGDHHPVLLMLDGVDRRAGGDAAEDRQFADVVGGAAGRGGGAAGLHQLRTERRAGLGRAGGGVFRQADHFQRPGAVGQAAQETALFQGSDQPVDARLGRQVQSFLHLVERGRDPGLLDPLMDEHEKFVLLTCEHFGPRNKPQTSGDVLYAFSINVKLTVFRA